MALRTVSLKDLDSIIGEEIGPTPPVQVTQSLIDGFADLTGDRQWIHVDTDRAADGPFGTTVAHGFLTLSLTPIFLEQLLEVDEVSAGVNYGLDRCRFPTVVPSGSSLEGRLVVRDVAHVGEGARRAFAEITMTIPQKPKPACTATLIVQYYP